MALSESASKGKNGNQRGDEDRGIGEGWRGQACQYAREDFWYRTGRAVDSAKPDVFYIVSTMILDSFDAQGNKLVQAVLSEDDRAALDCEFSDISTNMFDESFNFFAPYYHQITMNAGMAASPRERKELFAKVQAEVNQAFDYYMAHLNNGRPFVLAGYSQGSVLVKGVLAHMTDAQHKAMAAAYVMGGPLTAQDLKSPHIVPACGADDLGVTVSYNSAASLDAQWDVLADTSVACINPLNWATDETPAAFTYEGEEGVAHVDRQNHLIIVEGLDPSRHYLPGWPFPLGNYHSDETHFYARAIRENALLRLEKARGVRP